LEKDLTTKKQAKEQKELQWKAMKVFKLLDVNNDKVLDKWEILRIFSVKKAESFIQKVDFNKDGQLSPTEWLELFNVNAEIRKNLDSILKKAEENKNKKIWLD